MEYHLEDKSGGWSHLWVISADFLTHCLCINHLTCKAEFKLNVVWIKLSWRKFVERCYSAEHECYKAVYKKEKWFSIHCWCLGVCFGHFWNTWEKTRVGPSSGSFFIGILSWFIVSMWDSRIWTRWAQIQCAASVSLIFLLLKACVHFFGWGGMHRSSVLHTSLVAGKGDYWSKYFVLIHKDNNFTPL